MTPRRAEWEGLGTPGRTMIHWLSFVGDSAAVSWFKIDDGFHNHPKILAAGNTAAGLWCRLGAYAAQHSTNGFVPLLTSRNYGSDRILSKLVACGLLERVPGGYMIHDYLDWNPSREQVQASRRAAAARQARMRARKAVDSGGAIHRNEAGHGVTSEGSHGVSHGSSHASPSRRDGTTSRPKGGTGRPSLRAVPSPPLKCEDHLLPMPCRSCRADEIAKDGS